MEVVATGREQQMPVKLLSVDSVFVCLGGQPLIAHSRGAVNLINCTAEGASESWEFYFDAHMRDAIKIPLSQDPGSCLGVVGGVLGTDPCESNYAVVEWSWKNSSGMFLLRHIATDLCLVRESGESAVGDPGFAVLKACPIVTSSPVYDKREPLGPFRSYMWIPAAFPQLVPLSELPLQRQGANLIGRSGSVVKLRGGNWYGAHMEQFVNNGLDFITVEEFARSVLNIGFNSVRMNFATQQFFEDPLIQDQFLAANPNLKGNTSMDIFDYCIHVLTRHGLLVILNNHVTINRWCCDDTKDDNALWFNKRWPETKWFEMLTKMSARYKTNRRVIGIDLRNEVRPDLHDDDAWWLPWWGPLHGNKKIVIDWRVAAQEGAKAVWHGNPDALVFVEGAWGLDLSTIAQKPLIFAQECLQSRLVYSIHDYPWMVNWYRILDIVGDAGSPTLRRLAQLWRLLTRKFGAPEGKYEEFVRNRDAWGSFVRHDLASVWVGEFGGDLVSPNNPDSVLFLDYFMRLAAELDLDWCYWPIDGYKKHRTEQEKQETGDSHVQETYGILSTGYTSIRQGDLLLRMLRMLATSGVQKKLERRRGNSTLCLFDPDLHVVRGTGELGGAWSVQQASVVVVFVILLFCAICFGVWRMSVKRNAFDLATNRFCKRITRNVHVGVHSSRKEIFDV